MAFKDLKKTSSKSFAELRGKIETEQKGNNFVDERIWNPIIDKAGNGFAVIRFLPAPDGEEIPYVRLYNHGFKNDAGKWFIENCPTTIGEKCFCCEQNSILWNTGLKSEQEIVRKRKRGLSYYSNILVLSHPANPADDGKVFLFRFGSKIFEKITAAIQPEFPDEKPYNPFDFWEGANFTLKIRNYEGYRNYDRSTFEKPQPLFDGDDTRLEELWKKEYSLVELISDDKFKSYDELKAKFLAVVSGTKSQEDVVPKSKAPVQDSAPWDDVPKNTSSDEDDLQMYADLLNS